MRPPKGALMQTRYREFPCGEVERPLACILVESFPNQKTLGLWPLHAPRMLVKGKPRRGCVATLDKHSERAICVYRVFWLGKLSFNPTFKPARLMAEAFGLWPARLERLWPSTVATRPCLADGLLLKMAVRPSAVWLSAREPPP